MIKSFLISSFILFCATIIESSILSNISFLYVVPDLVLICSIYFSLLNGRLYGEVSGFVSGIFLDFISGIPFGFNCIYRTIIGYVYGFFYDSVIVSGILMPVLGVGVGTLGKHIFIHIISFMFPNTSLYVSGIISYTFLFELIINIILAPVIFQFLDYFKKSLSIINTKDKLDNV